MVRSHPGAQIKIKVMEALKFYLHSGPGHYVGSTIIVSAENIDSASSMIRGILDNGGLSDEELNVREFASTQSEVILADLGDY